MRRSSAIASLLLVLTLICSALALGARRPSFGGTVRVPTAGPVRGQDPVEATWPTEVLLASLLFDSPLRLDPSGRPRPHVLSHSSVEGDERTLRWNVRRHLVSHDGSPIGAPEVVASLARLEASDRYGFLLAMLEGAPRAVDRTTVEARLRSSGGSALLEAALAAPQAGIASTTRRAVRGVGTGPFALRKRVGSERRLRANRDYFDGPAYLDGVTLLGSATREEHIRRFQLGRADGSLLGTSVYGERPPRGKSSLASGPRTHLACLVVNSRRPLLEKAGARRALSLALDRSRHVSSSVETAWFAKASKGPSRNLAAARRLLGQALGPGGGASTLTLIVDAADPHGQAAAPLIERDLEAAGLSVDTAIVSGSAYRQAIQRNRWDLRMVTLAPVSPDEVLQLGQLLALGGLGEEAERLVRRASSGAVGPARADALQTLEARMLVIPLTRRAPRLHHRPEARGVRFDALSLLDATNIWMRTSPPAPGGGR